jgi:hypothetical protein
MEIYKRKEEQMKNNENNVNVSSGIGFIEALQIVFIVLKLVKVINWSWIWVLSPTWISLLITIICLLIAWIIYKK